MQMARQVGISQKTPIFAWKLLCKILDGVDGPRSPASMCHNVVVGERHN
jgi:hypothetical protein